MATADVEDCESEPDCEVCENTGFVDSSCSCDGRSSCPLCWGAASAPCGECARGECVPSGSGTASSPGFTFWEDDEWEEV